MSPSWAGVEEETEISKPTLVADAPCSVPGAAGCSVAFGTFSVSAGLFLTALQTNSSADPFILEYPWLEVRDILLKNVLDR